MAIYIKIRTEVDCESDAMMKERVFVLPSHGKCRIGKGSVTEETVLLGFGGS